MLQILILTSFVLANNYCVETKDRKCADVCKDLEFIKTFENYIPSDSDLPGEDEVHNIYIADNIEYGNTKHNIIFCDSSNYLYISLYKNTVTIRNNVIYTNSGNYDLKVPFLINLDGNITFEIDPDDTIEYPNIYIRATNDDNFLIPIFLTDKIPQDLFQVAEDSHNINLYEKTKLFNQAFKQTDKFVEVPKTYYCISDKQNKCEDYSMHDLVYIDNATEIEKFPNIVIVDTSVHQYFAENRNKDYFRIIGLPGSDFTYYYTGYDYHAILHPNSIELKNGFFEGEGHFTLMANYFKIHSATKVNNNHFKLKSFAPFNSFYCQLVAYVPGVELEIDKKIEVDDYTTFGGDKTLTGLFETGKFFAFDENELIKSVENLKESNYVNFNYRFDDGEFNIPKTWRKKSSFIGKKNTKFIFNEVTNYSCMVGRTNPNPKIDSYITVIGYESITINPSSYFNLETFSKYKYEDKLIINVEKDFIMNGKNFYDSMLDRDEINNENKNCSIVGSGTIKFLNELLMDDLKYFCNIDDTVKMEYIGQKWLNYSVCIGKSSLEECKSEILGINSMNDVEWLWIKNTETIKNVNYILHEVYLTDDQYIDDYDYKSNFILTPNADVLVDKYTIDVYKDHVNNLYVQSKSAKITILLANNFEYTSSNIDPYTHFLFELHYYEEPTDINFQIYLNDEAYILYTYYVENFAKNSIVIKGTCSIYLREYLKPMIDIFNYPETIIFTIDYDSYYSSICYSDSPIKCENLDNFIMPKNEEEFLKYELSSSYLTNIYFYKDITLSLVDPKSLNHDEFYCGNGVSLTLKVPNNAIISMYYGGIDVSLEKMILFSFANKNIDNINFIFDIEEKVNIQCSNTYKGPKSITLTSSNKEIEVITNSNIKLLDHIYFSDGLSIKSPVPQLLKNVSNSENIVRSTSWSYLYLSEEGKSLYESYESYPLTDFETDDNLLENIVLAVANDDSVSIPPKWTHFHNILVLQESKSFWKDQPKNVTYQLDGVIFDSKVKIVVGDVLINASRNFSVSTDFSIINSLRNIMYQTSFYIMDNSDTYIYPDSLNGNRYISYLDLVSIRNLNSTNMLFIKVKNSDDLSNFENVLDAYPSEYVEYSIMYDYICYFPYSDISSECSGNYFGASDSEALLMAVRGNPEKPVFVGQDVLIPYLNQNHIILNLRKENLKITLPYSPNSMTINENDFIQFNYPDLSVIDILDKSVINVGLKDEFELNIKSTTESLITVSLGSDVLLSKNSNCPSTVKISVTENEYNLYAENVDKFIPIFGDIIKKYIRICAFDSESSSLCTFDEKDSIENVFNNPFSYSEIEVAISENDQEITLPSLNKKLYVNIIPISSSSVLNVNSVYDVEIGLNTIIINDFWNFAGDLKTLNLILNSSSSLSITDEISANISIQLTSNSYYIDLGNCVELMNSKIHIFNLNSSICKVTVLGTQDNFDKLLNNLIYDSNIKFILDGSQKYVCFCDNESECNRCKEGINGIISFNDHLYQDYSSDTQLRIFKDLQVQTHTFKNGCEVYIDSKYHFNLTQVNLIDLNIERGLQADFLVFINPTNLLIKKFGYIKINLRKGNQGPHFSIEMETFLKLNVPNIDEDGVNASRLYVTGYGELNVYQYPYNRIRNLSPNVTVIEGYIIICNNVCSAQIYGEYKVLHQYDRFRPDFEQDARISAFLNTFTSNIDANIDYLNHHRVYFDSRNTLNNVLEGSNKPKLRFVSTTELTSNSNSYTELAGHFGGASIQSIDAESVIIGFNESLTIKKSGDKLSKITKYVIQPMNDETKLFIDDSCDLEMQKIQIQTENEKTVSVTVLTNKNITEKELDEFLQKDPEKVKITIGENPKPKSKKLSKGAIAGIVVAVIVITALIILLIVLLTRKYKKGYYISDIASESSDTVGI